jgi:hypothetical protein
MDRLYVAKESSIVDLRLERSAPASEQLSHHFFELSALHKCLLQTALPLETVGGELFPLLT